MALRVLVYFKAEAVGILSGEVKDDNFTAESGRGFTTRICTHCGTSQFSKVGSFSHLIGVAGGTFDPPNFWYEVKREVFTRSRAPFVQTDITGASETSSGYVSAAANAARLMAR